MTSILVVDDEPLIAMALEAVLEDAGYQVMMAANGRQGLERLAETRADVVLLDMMMPVMNGPAMLAAMAAEPSLAEIPVIILSSLPEEVVRIRAQGSAMILRKPYTAHEVLDAIARVLGEAREAGGDPGSPTP
ncbi:response regulator [Geminicoccus flavidas]|uniref:response regulator n=1 Tax=Geminicoccus flavidas TaxID=2506407 RepID=UPI0013592770|nr:response regulator [Geminicoccus flavidas]